MCPGCAPDQLDLSSAAFARVQSTRAGTVPVSYQVARDPALPSPLAVRVGPGSNADAFAIQILNHGNPLSGVQVNGHALTLRPDGYWIADTGPLARGPVAPGPIAQRASATASKTC